MAEKYIYGFMKSKSEMPDVDKPKYILGGKGFSLVGMVELGLPVPPGFVISIGMCEYFYNNGKKYPEIFEKELKEYISLLEGETGKKFGDPKNPLLLSVRSGAAVSMPGMMDTVLNLGLNEETLNGLIDKSGNPRFAWDSYRRFIQMFGNVVMGIEHEKFEGTLEEVKQENAVEADIDLDVDALKEVVKRYLNLYETELGEKFPTDPMDQLKKGIDAVFGSWNNPRAISYRKINKISSEISGTAVNVQTMVFGNMGDNSGTGVAFTRNPSTGEKEYYGEYLMNAQGEDVVAGIRTPKHLNDLEKEMPEIYQQIKEIFTVLENHYKDMIDLEFTIEEGQLYMLQNRVGKRTGKAAVKIAVDMVGEKMINKNEAIMRVDPNSLDQLLHPMVDPKADKEIIATGLPASPGAVSGQVVFTADDAVSWKEQGKDVILVRTETSPEDIEGMNSAQGILTARGGMTSHAAVVARGMGKCCVAGCSEIAINEESKTMHVGKDVDLEEGDWITLDGSTGDVFKGKVQTVDPELSEDFETLMAWADDVRTLKVRTNADTPADAKIAREFGAEGIGLTRTEHMFFQEERIFAVREMILSDTKEQRVKALSKIEKMQQDDFEGIFEEMDGLPVTVRLLDPPLHEFLPHEDEDIRSIAKEMGVEYEELKKRKEALAEFNPMLGFRGCRLGMVYPEITEMQVKAIINAAVEVTKKGVKAIPEIEIPVTSHVRELEILRDVTVKTADEILKAAGEIGKKVSYTVGTMIELPRACVTADEFAQHADFFSFGTNDLTQTTFGYSRDDAGRFIVKYIELGVYENDPFQVLDQCGVGEMMKMAVTKGRSAKKSLEIGICGEHGGEPESVKFCHRIGLNYVSCSPYRVPIARLAAAQAALEK
ncbi:pyruvate, phosphate dikinase [Candidatus Dojkabacteria bacterium]|nr:pyruvate, phosphate dikinase [Candidatus Dojkabacteria bacterium]